MDTATGGGGGGTLVPSLAKEIMSIFEMAIYFLRGIICSEDLSFGHVLLCLLIGALCLVLIYAVGKLSRECCVPHHATIQTIQEHFPNALTNPELLTFIEQSLAKYKYNNKEMPSLVATCLCSCCCCGCNDVLNNDFPLREDLATLFGGSDLCDDDSCCFDMGGLAGFAFGGITSFKVMMSRHVPNGGNCLIVYGPHVGIDAAGNAGGGTPVNHVEGTGTTACCRSAIAAANHVLTMLKIGGDDEKTNPSRPPSPVLIDAKDDDPLDTQQQALVNALLLPHAVRLEHATRSNNNTMMIELPYIMFDAQDALMRQIVEKGCQHIMQSASCKTPTTGKIAMLGGITINTCEGLSDYFMPLRFHVFNKQGEHLETILDKSNGSISRAKIGTVFPGAIPNAELIERITASLAPFGYNRSSSMVATSFCGDEVNRPLENALRKALGPQYFNMGGLAGFAFGGVTSFGTMARHIPKRGNCLIVYGPHCGVDSSGKVGVVHRRGRAKSEACCGNAVAAFLYVQSVVNGTAATSTRNKNKGTAVGATATADPADAQQAFVGKLLLPYGKRLQAAKDPMVELPYHLFEAQDELMLKIVQKGAKHVAGRGNIALLGGIQINCDSGVSDYFLPLRFEIFNNEGRLLMDLLVK